MPTLFAPHGNIPGSSLPLPVHKPQKIAAAYKNMHAAI